MITLQEVGGRELTFYFNGGVYKFNWFQNIPLNIKEKVSIGIDQSSTSTGIAIVGENTVLLTEFKRGDLTVSTYRRALVQQLEGMIRDLDIEFFIYEEHGTYITPLESVINRVTDSIKEYTKYKFRIDTEVSGVSPVLWRSGFLIGDKYENKFTRDKVKEACVERSLELYPGLKKYIKYCSKDFDAFEALGIVVGYKTLNFNQEGKRIVNRTMKKDARRKVDYVIHKVNVYEIDEQIERLKRFYKSEDIAEVISNPDILLNETVNRVSGRYDESLIIYSKCPEFCRLVLETGEVWNEGETYIVYCKRS